MTAPWAWSPETLKPTADKELAMGPEPLRHPHFGAPAADRCRHAGPWAGAVWPVVHPQRNVGGTGEAWVTYLARSSYMLQQGQFAADVVYFYGEDSNLTAIFAHKVAGRTRRLQLRLHQCRRADSQIERRKRTTGHTKRHAL